MSGLFGGGTINNTAEKLSTIRIQSSAWGLPIPVVYGKARLSANLIYYNDFKAVPHTTSQRTGKGGSTTVSNTTYTYTAAVMMAVAEGPISISGRVWVDKEVHPDPGSIGFTTATGTISQTPWSYLLSRHPDQAVGYGSTAWVAHPELDLGSSATTRNHSFEVVGLCAGPTGDANPADILMDMLTNPVHGGGWPSSAIADLSNFRSYCSAAGLLLSPVYDQQQALSEHVKALLEASNAAAVWSGGKLKIIPYADQPVGSWTPNTTPVYALGFDDFLVSPGEDPVRVIRKTQADAYNQVQVEFANRNNEYISEVVDATDLANIELYGLRQQSPVRANGVCSPDVARTLAQILLQRSLYIRNTYEFRLGWRYALLEPMDLVTLTDPNLGLNNTPVRIVEVEEDEDGTITVRAEEWPFGVATAVLYPTGGGTSGGIDMAADPGPCNPPVIFEPPGDLTNGVPQVWIGTSGGTNWGGCEIWASRDGSTYALVGRITAPARHGTLTAGLAVPPASNPDTTNVLQVDISASGGVLLSASQTDADHWETLCYVDGEILAYRTATLTGTGRYSLSYLRRGLYGTAPSSPHLAGSAFLRLDEAVGAVDLDRWNVGETIQIKLRSFNRYGLRLQDLSSLTPISYTIQGRVKIWPAPSSVTIAISSTPPPA